MSFNIIKSKHPEIPVLLGSELGQYKTKWSFFYLTGFDLPLVHVPPSDQC